ncbi:YdeI/OmpD-associated family protein [Gordonia liuliyuniae]|uniref:YdeI/OmpD-associated family protein n=1 Tax=Gordonia liuliyuniae TaxID=2911517 RepID=A0ABS9IQ19_9ACTN|nr:YdeI/OmpD-associated family protein [Gordonia liuliyuniae]MCF8587654.1 YdeI/OmpD-associated family protein [Gordonia liuliyuniae]
MSASAPITFDAQIDEVNGQTIVRLPAEASAALPSRGQVAVTGSIDGHDYATVVEPDGNRGHWIRLDEPLASALGAAGTVVATTIVPAEQWPEPVVPDDFRSALDDAADIAQLWREITPMARWEWVRWVQATKNPTTRARRVDVGVSKLRDGKRRPCCFDLSSCTDPNVAKSGVLIGAK